MLLATCAGVAALAGVAPALAAGPAVRVPDLTPLTVRGLGFAPGEKVTVSVAWHGMHTRTAVATPVGTFLVHFWSMDVGGCDVFMVRATGSRGDQALFRHRLVDEACGAQLDP